MRVRRLAAYLLCLVVAAAEIFGFLPSLHECVRHSAAVATAPAAAGDTHVAAVPTAPDGQPVRLRGRQVAPPAEDCPACRLLGLVLVASRTQPVAAPLPRQAPPFVAAPAPCLALRQDRACGRAPPLA
jgi:hypothetical protein